MQARVARKAFYPKIHHEERHKPTTTWRSTALQLRSCVEVNLHLGFVLNDTNIRDEGSKTGWWLTVKFVAIRMPLVQRGAGAPDECQRVVVHRPVQRRKRLVDLRYIR